MTTHRDAEHEPWEELAAGYALHALEPDEEMTFSAHLETCARCREVLDEHALVAAQLGALAQDSDAHAPSWRSIRSGIVAPDAEGPAVSPPAIASLEEQRAVRRRQPRLLAAAAGVALLTGAALAVWQFSGSSPQSGAAAAIASCHDTPACHVIGLDGKAVVLADGDQARVISRGLPARSTGHVYALWQMPTHGRPVLLTVLDSLSEAEASPPAGLVLPYRDTSAFALSVEPAGARPSQPTQVVAVGNATA
ncbi:MAG: hypothetical protein QOJ03_90 [Frankiaceae bacterium]|nr:hypothetical protein [Frankiaceae bacterium]